VFCSVKAQSQVSFCASRGHLILKMQHSTTRQGKQKISANLDHHWSKVLISLCANEVVFASGTQRFCKNDPDSSLKSLAVTRVDLSHSVKNVTRNESSRVTIFLNVTRVESESPKIVTRVESLTRVTLSLEARLKIETNAINNLNRFETVL